MERVRGRCLADLGSDRGQDLLGELERQGLLGQGRVGARADERAFERPDVAGHALSEQVEHAAGGELVGFGPGQAPEDGAPHGLAGRGELDQQAALEPVP